jgi:rubredoxin
LSFEGNIILLTFGLLALLSICSMDRYPAPYGEKDADFPSYKAKCPHCEFSSYYWSWDIKRDGSYTCKNCKSKVVPDGKMVHAPSIPKFSSTPYVRRVCLHCNETSRYYPFELNRIGKLGTYKCKVCQKSYSDSKTQKGIESCEYCSFTLYSEDRLCPYCGAPVSLS